MFKLDFRKTYDNAIRNLCVIVHERSYRFRKHGYNFVRRETWYDFDDQYKYWIEKVGAARAAKMLNHDNIH